MSGNGSKEREQRLKRMCKKLALLKWQELDNLGIPPSVIRKIKAGAVHLFREPTLLRLEKEVR